MLLLASIASQWVLCAVLLRVRPLVLCAQDYEAKMRRGDGMGDKKSMAFFDGINAAATETCTDALQLGPYI